NGRANARTCRALTRATPDGGGCKTSWDRVPAAVPQQPPQAAGSHQMLSAPPSSNFPSTTQPPTKTVRTSAPPPSPEEIRTQWAKGLKRVDLSSHPALEKAFEEVSLGKASSETDEAMQQLMDI